jgi:hypothetical protein
MCMYPHSIHTNIVTTDLVYSAVAQSVVIIPDCLSHISVTVNLISLFLFFQNFVYKITVCSIFKHYLVQYSQSYRTDKPLVTVLPAAVQSVVWVVTPQRNSCKSILNAVRLTLYKKRTKISGLQTISTKNNSQDTIWHLNIIIEVGQM